MLEPEIVEKSAFYLVGSLYVGDAANGEIAALWDRWGRFVAAIPSAEPGFVYGAMRSRDRPSNAMEYLVAAPVGRVAPTPHGLTRWELPAQTYAVFPCTLSAMPHVTSFIAESWLPRSGFERADGVELERYGPNFGLPTRELELWVPIRRANLLGSGGP